MTTPTMAMVRVLAVEVGAGAFLHGGGDFLHAGVAGVGGQHLPRGDQAVDQRQQAAGDDDDIRQDHAERFLYRSRVRRDGLRRLGPGKQRRQVRADMPEPRRAGNDGPLLRGTGRAGDKRGHAPVAQLVRAGRS